MPTKKQYSHIEIRCCTMRVRQYFRENTALYGRRNSVLVCPDCNMPSFAPCLHEEADTRIFARATEAAKRPNKKISSCSSSGHTCGATVVNG